MPIMTAAVGPTKAQGAVMATRPASMPLQAIEMSGFPKKRYQRSMAAADAGHGGEIRVDRDYCDAQVGGAERGAWVEAHPAEQQEEGAGDDEDEVVRWEGSRLAVLSYLPMRGPRIMARAMAQKPPTPWTTVEPAKSRSRGRGAWWCQVATSSRRPRPSMPKIGIEQARP